MLGKLCEASIQTFAMFSKGVAFRGWKGMLRLCVSVLESVVLFQAGRGEIAPTERAPYSAMIRMPTIPSSET